MIIHDTTKEGDFARYMAEARALPGLCIESTSGRSFRRGGRRRGSCRRRGSRRRRGSCCRRGGGAAKAAADALGARAALTSELPKKPCGGADGMAEDAEEIPGRPVFSVGAREE